ncbi:hypothetical protein [Pseudoduganella albidiflava]|uniref:Uncharacterized protein n=1 Tax=Pseudoduganella albidiflava TaxID=321983 RepID=A0A411WUH6_9BURK|nr:hypothetical protein [Pseudoduganella albidiflava]QBI00406.1 hypothetical protein EYF70_05740 [Pseudoduganella albidiflava]GGY53678.1 hypothetical protein GCM10007387_40150 [Pseudoduganella albidiflava]
MAGAILVTEKNGVSLSSIDFDYIIEKIRPNFNDSEKDVREEIYSPVDDGGMSFISLVEQCAERFNAFVRAASIAYENEIKEQPFSARRNSWDELLTALRSDPRYGKS